MIQAPGDTGPRGHKGILNLKVVSRGPKNAHLGELFPFFMA